MPMRTFFRDQRFDPEVLEAMSAAFTEACATLRLKHKADPITELVAAHIIDTARKGMRTKEAMYIAAMKEFNADAK